VIEILDFAEGERRRDDALALLAGRRAAAIRAGQRALLLRLLDFGVATADDVRAAVELPPGIGPRCYGAVPIPFVEAGIIFPVGYQRTARPLAHARPVTVWASTDSSAALAWLADHPLMPDPEPAATIQRQLWEIDLKLGEPNYNTRLARPFKTGDFLK
jgi:hypothetical protein